MSDPLSFHSLWPHYSPEPNTTYHLILIPLLECNFHSCCNCIFFSFLWYSYLCCICISAARYLIVANVGQTSFWHFCHDRNCNNQPKQHKRHNPKLEPFAIKSFLLLPKLPDAEFALPPYLKLLKSSDQWGVVKNQSKNPIPLIERSSKQFLFSRLLIRKGLNSHM